MQISPPSLLNRHEYLKLNESDHWSISIRILCSDSQPYSGVSTRSLSYNLLLGPVLKKRDRSKVHFVLMNIFLLQKGKRHFCSFRLGRGMKANKTWHYNGGWCDCIMKNKDKGIKNRILFLMQKVEGKSWFENASFKSRLSLFSEIRLSFANAEYLLLPSFGRLLSLCSTPQKPWLIKQINIRSQRCSTEQ